MAEPADEGVRPQGRVGPPVSADPPGPGSLQGVAIADGYSTSDGDLIDLFYAPLLAESVRYDRAVGYFSSALLALAPLAFASFIGRGGRIRLVCSPHLIEADAARLDIPVSASMDPEEIVNQLRALCDSNDLAAALTQVMSSLLASGILTMKFARPVSGKLFHDKIGILTDESNARVSFVGSANETASAWSDNGNHEQIEVFCSWRSSEQMDRVRRHKRQFDEIWRGLARGLSIEAASKSAALIYEVSKPDAPEVSLEKLKQVIERRREAQLGLSGRPKRTLKPHQDAVLASWRAASFRGLITFATGGGKTLAAIRAIKEWTATGRPAIVLVPSELLHRQWQRELAAELDGVTLLLAGAGSIKVSWIHTLSAATSADSELGPRLVLATYQTAVSPDFLDRVHIGPHLLVVADEVHRMGAPDTQRLFDIDAGGRLGLSATPERYGDPIGSKRIRDYFGDELEPPFTIRDAVASGQLAPYDYFLETCELTEDESDRWAELSAKLAQEIARNDGATTERALMLARSRARILKSAAHKNLLAEQVIQEHYRAGDHWLVYCESRAHLQTVRRDLEKNGRPVTEYHSGNSELGPHLFKHFERGGILLAIKCLDEGVDLPFINRALILASTSNPREYIQRRGRVLRTAPRKTHAQVFDVAVVDRNGALLAPSEALRAADFARDASNKSGLFKLQTLIRSSGLDSARFDLPLENDLSLEDSK